MDGQDEQSKRDDAAARRIEAVSSIGLSRRDFTRRFGGGSVAAVGLVWAAPKITTIKYAAKAKAGSPPPTSTTTTSTSVPVGELGHISVTETSPCVGDTIHVKADGFAPKTAVTIEIDSPAHTLGVTTASSSGKINVLVKLPSNGPTGARTVKAVGVQPGGRTLTLSAPITIKTEADCGVHNEGSTTTTTPTGTVGSTSPSSTSSTTPTTKASDKQQQEGGGGTLGGNSLAFTGTDAVNLALVGGAAAIGGRALYGLARRSDEDEHEDE
jgi:hypothetical protein